MPIKQINKHRYPRDWKRISQDARSRAGNRCEQCGLANHVMVFRGTGEHSCITLVIGAGYRCSDTGAAMPEPHGFTHKDKPTMVVLTVSHTDHQPENCDPSNLRALCQRCHFKHDRDHHRESRLWGTGCTPIGMLQISNLRGKDASGHDAQTMRAEHITGPPRVRDMRGSVGVGDRVPGTEHRN